MSNTSITKFIAVSVRHFRMKWLQNYDCRLLSIRILCIKRHGTARNFHRCILYLINAASIFAVALND